MSEPITPFEMVGDVDGGVCIDGVCAVPAVSEDAEADPAPR